MPKTTKPNQQSLARDFLALHNGPKILVLPNAWDVPSARIFEQTGFPAIATTSAGIANSLGYADGQNIPRNEMLAAVHRIAESVAVPVTADMEAGYGTTPEELEDMAREVISAGAVGMNLEDGVAGRPDQIADLARQKENIAAVVEASNRLGVALLVNARTDIFLHSIGPAETRLARSLERLNSYREAGAQCLFAPGVTDERTIGDLVHGLTGPLNVLANPGTPSVSVLQKLGVARVSLGSGPMRATLGLLTRLAGQLMREGTFQLMTEGAVSYADSNRLVEAKK
jgi:2-methylisocitrate lyase-like PEP mutase family enzyme